MKNICQSCGMPLSEGILGSNSDNSNNEDYCKFCYQKGKFTQKCTMEEMASHCSEFVDVFNSNTGKNLTKLEYKEMLLSYFPNLKRWKK